MLAKNYAQDYGIEPQQDGESKQAFKERVAEQLRQGGHIIEAHEVMANARYDEPGSDAMAGVFGAVAKAMQGKQYAGSQVASDMAAGVVAQQPSDEIADALLVALVMSSL